MIQARTWCLLGALISLAALTVVHALETFGHYLPCELCLRQREVYWTAFGIGGVAWIVSARRPSLARVGCVALAIAFAVGAGVAAYHAGVEWKWWPGPTACTGTASAGGVSAAAVADIFSGKTKLHMVRCDDAAFRIAGLSLSGWNALASTGLAAISLAALRRRRVTL